VIYYSFYYFYVVLLDVQVSMLLASTTFTWMLCLILVCCFTGNNRYYAWSLPISGVGQAPRYYTWFFAYFLVCDNLLDTTLGFGLLTLLVLVPIWLWLAI
jgi:hypothetical protein